MRPLASGGVFAGRFEILAEAGSGGTGTVYRARDQFSGDIVALKVMHANKGSRQEGERFSREAKLLAEIHHPRIVSYIAHGEASDGDRYLAMEWLTGQDLAQHLQAGPLSITNTCLLGRGIAEALDVAHKRGIVHRDIKPSNVYLSQGRIDQVKVLDFGIARRFSTLAAVTSTGVLVGTPAYMAPEQAHGARSITPAADIFSLGCVLYECLTGRPPFMADHVAAVIARVLFDEVPSPRLIRPEIPVVLEELLMQMLVKDPNKRLATAADLLAALTIVEAGLSVATAGIAAPFVGQAMGRADSDQLLVNVILALPSTNRRSQTSAQDTVQDDPTVELLQKAHPTLRDALNELGVQNDWPPDGSLLVTLSEHSSATDQVSRAAQIGLLIKHHWPEAQVVLTTGLGAARQGSLFGTAMTRASSLARQHDTRLRTEPRLSPSGLPLVSAPTSHITGVWVDELSARLLERHYSLTETQGGMVLTDQPRPLDHAYQLLGKPTACVGREQELGTLEIALGACIEESVAKLVLVTGPPGFGKSRLLHEFLHRARGRIADLRVLHGRADLMSQGTALYVLSQALCRYAGLESSQVADTQRELLTSKLGKHLPDDRRTRILEFVAELCGLPMVSTESEPLRAARSDPKIMKDQLRQAFIELIQAESQQGPVLLVLEDLHWGDALTVRLIELMMRQLVDCPLLVLILSRPEVHELFPRLSKVIGSQELTLKGLSRRACERLIVQALGKRADKAMVESITQLSLGNPLYLEELIRAAAESPDSIRQSGEYRAVAEHPTAAVLAMLQARLTQLDPQARKILRAASIFGASFWVRGIEHLAGLSPEATAHWLEHLVQLEYIERSASSRYQHQVEYQFRHLLMRDAVYTLLTEIDRRGGHLAAAFFLQQAGETDAQVVAEHFREGLDLDRAIECYVLAATRSHDRDDLDGMLAQAKKGLAAGSKGATRGTLLAMACISQGAGMQWGPALEAGQEALTLLPTGSLWWCRALAQLIVIAPAHADPHLMQRLIQACASARPAEDAQVAYLEAAAQLAAHCCLLGDRDHALAFSIFATQLATPHAQKNPLLAAWAHYASGWYALTLDASPDEALHAAQVAVAAFAAAEAHRDRALALVLLGLVQVDQGDAEHGVNALREAYAIGLRLREPALILYARSHLALGLALAGPKVPVAWHDEASELAEQTIAVAPDLYDPVARTAALTSRALCDLYRHQLTQCLGTCQTFAQEHRTVPLYTLLCQTVHVLALIASNASGPLAAAAGQLADQADRLETPIFGDVSVAQTLALAATHLQDSAAAQRRDQLVEDLIKARCDSLADPTGERKPLYRARLNWAKDVLAPQRGDRNR